MRQWLDLTCVLKKEFEVKTVPGVVTVAGPGKVSGEMYVAELESVVRLRAEPGLAVQETLGTELTDGLEPVVDSGREQETVLGHCFEADTVLPLGVWMTVLGWAVLQKEHGRPRLSWFELQAESELPAGLGTGTELGAGAVLKAGQAVAGLLEDSSPVTERVAGSSQAAPVSGVLIYSVSVHWYLWKGKIQYFCDSTTYNCG